MREFETNNKNCEMQKTEGGGVGKDKRDQNGYG